MLCWSRVRTRTRSAIEDLKDFIIPSLSGVSRVRLPSPPVTHLLKSNDPPTEDEAALIREAIDLAEVEQSRLRRIYDSQMLTGTRAHASITRYKMRQLNRFIEKHKALLSSIRLLPAEIWQEIFHWLSPRHHLVSSSSSFHVPWELAQVCGDWRMNALAMSDLWRYLPAIYLTDSNPKTNLQLHYLGALIHRSKGAPLSIDIRCSISHDQRFHPVIALLCQHSDQWEDVRAMLSAATLTGLRYIEGRLPLLKSLVLSVFDDTQLQPDSPFTMFTIAPKLCTVELAGLVNGEVLLPFQQLVNYTEVSLRDSHLNQILNDGLLLETLTLLNFPGNVAFPFVTVPHLKKLEVKFWRGRTAHGRCFDNLILPSVEEIRATSDQVNIMPSLAIMLSKCGTSCPLKTLFIQCGPIACNELTNVIALTPLLANLNTSLPLSGAEEDIYNLANGYYQDRPLAPMLETCHFYLGNAIRSASTSAAINALASSRCELAAVDAAVRNAESLALLPEEIRPLKDLTIYFKRGMCAEKQLALLENWHAGTTARALQDMEADISRRVSWFHMPVAYKDEWMRWLAQVDNVKVTDFNDIYVRYILPSYDGTSGSPVFLSSGMGIEIWRLSGYCNEMATSLSPSLRPTLSDNLPDTGLDPVGANDEVKIPLIAE
ncbi:hypothetical protein D9613_000069 [Agrocybe pediades]|uniref:F-box domain-containing protein n=1 Tax=Agrocybe pediades TaxID=84607 RepID=A0A8H4R320_9AGAR|nr:hypothetical protein D9613_000069 [Agrocybe pediades]